MKNKLRIFGLREKIADNDPNAYIYLILFINTKKRGIYEHGDT